MAVDLEAIAQRGRCETSNLRIALPLLEQGYSPPFLARYRRDELGGVDEGSLWALAASVESERAIADQRDLLKGSWEKTPLADPVIGHAISKANSKRMLDRLARRVKRELGEAATDANRLAVRILSPRRGDGADIAEIAAKVDGIENAEVAAKDKDLDNAIARRLAGDPRLISAAVRWLSKHARIHIASISDPHAATAGEKKDKRSTKSDDGAEQAPDISPEASEAGETVEESTTNPTSASTEAPVETPTSDDSAVSHVAAPTEDVVATAEDSASIADATESRGTASSGGDLAGSVPTSAPLAPCDSSAAAKEADSEESANTNASTETVDVSPTETGNASETADVLPAETSATTDDDESISLSGETSQDEAAAKGGEKRKKNAGKKAKDKTARPKKISPRQRRRRWLVSVLQPLAGKRIPSDKLSAFQIVMLGRALRSQVAVCAFEYDASRLVAELQKTAGGFNRLLETKLKEIILEHEANIREAAETAWWDELHERASTRLVGIAADRLRQHVNRGSVEAKTVMSIDAVGPRTAATAIVAADGRVLHCEDLPCQLSAAQRTQAVNRMGELIHAHHVDLIVISNGPARRASMIAVRELIKQSPEKSIRWTVADRSGADAYASSEVANQEMRSTPRRFRGAAWLAFSVLQPAQAFAKIDPLKLRLASFQRELAEEALKGTLESIIISGASRGGVDANSAPTSWLERLPGMSSEIAETIDAQRRKELLKSRAQILELAAWPSLVQSRQGVPFLRVFGSDEVLDGTLIHPDDYVLAKKLAKSLEIELPPASPPGYAPTEFPADVPPEKVTPGLSDATPVPEPAKVEDLTSAENTNESFGQANCEPGTEDGQPGDTAEETTIDSEPASDSASDDGEIAPAEPSNVAETAPAESTSSETNAEESPPQESAASAIESEAADESVSTSPAVSTEGDDASEPAAAPATSASDGETDATNAPPAFQMHEPIKRDRPEQSKIDKCIKEWQVGTARVNQLINWLCDPFGDSDASGQAHAVLTTMPSLKGLKEGDEVIGVVVGVMPFGVFVELAPDCSGLIHVSKISDSYVEDLHEAVQVGDVITGWVTGVDQKRRRVALSAISPQREAELQRIRSERTVGRGRGGPGRGQSERSGPRGGTAHQGKASPQGKPVGGGGGGAQPQRSRSGGGQAKSGQSGGGRRPARSDSRGGRGGKSRDTRGKRKPESYRVVSKADASPITAAMQSGDEPMRSFGDLLQFFDKDQTKPEATAEANIPPAAEQSEVSETETTPHESVTDSTISAGAQPKTESQNEVQSDESSSNEQAPAAEPTAASDSDSGDQAPGEESPQAQSSASPDASAP